MSIRWRKTGELLCGAKSKEMKGDTYIDDNLHYELAVECKILVPDINEKENGRWYWLRHTFPVFESNKYNHGDNTTSNN